MGVGVRFMVADVGGGVSLGSAIGCKRKLVTQSCLTLVTPWTVTHQAPLSMEFSRQEYWSGLP